MRIGFITIHNVLNYGAVLQATATYNILNNFGDVELLDYRNKFFDNKKNLLRVDSSIRGLLRLAQDSLTVISRERKIRRFGNFISDNVKFSNRFLSADEARFCSEKMDFIVCGSDQIWNPLCVSSNGSIDEIYFGSFVSDNQKLISYASSMGSHRYYGAEVEKVKRLLSRFAAISVREQESSEWLTKLLEKAVSDVLDPTLLLGKAEWEQYAANKSRSKNDYILVYLFNYDIRLITKIATFAKSNNIDVVLIYHSIRWFPKGWTIIRDAGPSEFLRYLLDACCVVTDSFHGTAFAVNFSKAICAIPPVGNESRVKNLLSKIGMISAMQYIDSNDFKLDFIYPKNEAVEKLESNRKASMLFLKTVLQS